VLDQLFIMTLQSDRQTDRQSGRKLCYIMLGTVSS